MSSSPERGGADQNHSHLRIHSVNIYVRDQDRSLRFYLDQLGFHLAFDARLQSGQRWVGVTPPDGSAVLTLIAPDPESPDYKLIGRPTQIVFVTEDVTARYVEWSARGVRFRHAPRLRRVQFEDAEKTPWGGVFTRFEDVDHNVFALVSLDKVSQAVEAQRRAVAERLEAERRAAHEMEIARQVQARLFPQTLPGAKTLEYAGVCMQARAVGGDYYDFLNLGQGRLGLVIADISGKGIAAALLMANLQANLRSQCAIALDEPERFLRSLNQVFYESTIEGAYATMFFGEYDDRAQRLRYANCGHLCGLLFRSDDRLERLDSTTTVLGLFDEWDCSIGETQLACGDTLALYTDGITESFDEAGEEFGEGRLIDALRRYRGLSSQALLTSVLNEVRRFSPQEQHDDITLIVARCRKAEAAAITTGQPR
jgi:serine phosphatase RsbU (regulator of sigma subunit)